MDSQAIFANLRDTFASLYPDEASARRVVADAGIDPLHIAFTTHALNNWHAILSQAAQTDHIDGLIGVALREYTENQALHDACAVYRSFVAQGGHLHLPAQSSSNGSERPKYEPHFYGPVQGVVIGDNNTVTLIFQGGEKRTVPFLAPPQPPYDLVGRTDLLPKLKQQLLSGNSIALSALNGLPGVGKTALAIALAHDRDILAHFQDGVLWAGLGREPAVLALLSAWAKAMGIPETEVAKTSTIKEQAEAVHAEISLRRMLLVIDDAWQTEAALAFKLGGPNCAHLITTRLPEIALRFTGKETTTVAELSETDGLALLTNLAPRVVEAEPEEARELVHAVGGLPLALILIGNYLRVQAHSGQPRRIHAALERFEEAKERLRLVEPQPPVGDHPGLPPGAPISLQAVIGISVEALDHAARRVLGALAVFPPKPNTFAEEAALAVCAAPVATLDTLADSGLLESSGPGRYTLHQTIADYAHAELDDPSAAARLVTFFVGYVDAHATDYNLLDLESNNVLAALQAAFEQKMQPALVQGVNAFYPFLESRGLYDEATTHLQRAEQAARLLGNDSSTVTTLLYRGRIVQRHQKYAQAETYLKEGLELARRLGEREKIIALLTDLGRTVDYRGNSAQAELYFQEGLATARALEDHRGVCDLLSNLGRLAILQEEFVQAKAYLQEALPLARQFGYRDILCDLLTFLGVLEYEVGDNVQAEAFYQEALELARPLGNREKISLLLTNLGEIARKLGNDAQAEKFLQEGLVLARQLRHHSRISHLLADLGLLAGQRGDNVQANVYLQESLTIAYQMERWKLAAEILAKWGELYLLKEELDLAAARFRECIELAQRAEIKEKKELGLAYYGLARVAAAQGNIAEARKQGQKSLAVFETISHYRTTEIRDWLDGLPTMDQGTLHLHGYIPEKEK